jgi:glycosyltransferase involved in cell wall biosynthesis
MKILVTESSMNWGGQEERTLHECLWLATRGHEIRIVGNADSALLQRASSEGLSTAQAPLRFAASPRGLGKIWREVTRFGPDVVNCHSQRDAWMCVPTRLAGVPVVRTQNISLPDRLSLERKWFYRNGCDHVIAGSSFIAQQLAEVVSPRTGVTVIGEGVNCEVFHPANNGTSFREQWNISPNTLLFGVVGTLLGEKGQALFLRAALLAWKANPDLRFVLVGEGARKNSTEETLRAYVAREFPKGDKCPIIFAGFQSDMPSVMAALDVLVVSSKRDAQTLVIPQAFATGKAVLGSKIGGIPDLIQHEKNGLLFPPNDKKAVVEGMLRLAKDRSLRIRLGNQARRFATEHLQIAGKMRALESVFARVVRNGKKPA